MASQNMQSIQGPKKDWTEDAELHEYFKDWREEAEFLIDTVLNHTKDKNAKMKFVSLWAKNEARTYLTTVDASKKGSLQAILDTLEEWTKPKADEIAAYTQLRALDQGNKTLSLYIQEVRRLCRLV